MVEANPDGDSDGWDQVWQFNQHFKSLLDLVPPQSYFTQEQKDEIFGNISGAFNFLFSQSYILSPSDTDTINLYRLGIECLIQLGLIIIILIIIIFF